MAQRKVKAQWQDKVMNHSQIGGIETSVLDNGPAAGTRIAWVNTGAGLRYKIVIDRSLDIVDAFYNQHSLAWISHAGVTSYRPDVNHDLEWLYTFGGGLVTTCGLTHVGGPDNDEDETRGLHGRISNLPAEIESIVQPDPAAGRLDMSITGVVRQTRVFGPNLELRRTISGRLGEPAVRINDTVTNRGSSSQPHMMLYHCNYGWPLVDEGTEFVWKGTCNSFGRESDDELFASKHNYRRCPASLESHRGSGEACGLIETTPDRSGMCSVGLHNRKLGLAVAMRYKKKQLPCLTNWQHWGFGDYVTGIEPGTNPPYGQNEARKQRKLIMLGAGKSRNYQLDISVLTQPTDIRAFTSGK